MLLHLSMAFLLSTSADVFPPDHSRGVWSDLAIIRSQSDEPSDRALLFAELYQRRLARELRNLPALPEAELHDLFLVLDAASRLSSVADYARRADYLDGMRAVVEELGRRGTRRELELEKYLEALVARRRFDDARRMETLVDPSVFRRYSGFMQQGWRVFEGRSGYTLGRGGKLRHRAIELPDDGSYVVVVIGCHIADRAAKALSLDPRLAGVLGGPRVVWLLGDAETDVDVIRQWKQDFPAFKAHIAFDNASWPGIDLASTPSFFFFRGGQLVQTLVGWGATVGPEQVADAFETIGLIEPSQKSGSSAEGRPVDSRSAGAGRR